MSNMDVPFVVGAYAAMPQQQAEQEQLYELLREADWIAGLELPYPGDIANNSEWLEKQCNPDWIHSTITAIPGTMQHLAKDGSFGLASPDADGRQAALDFTEEIRQKLCEFSDRNGRRAVRAVQVHSAPTIDANVDFFMKSLEELKERDWCGAELVIEHCDSPRPGRTPEKGFLRFEEELHAATTVGVGMHINWGRSTLEAEDPHWVVNQLVEAGSAHVLRGLIFSGVANRGTPYGPAWADGHLPHRDDEPASLLDDETITESVRAARAGGVQYLGAKICVPPEASIAQRLEMIKHIYRAVDAA